jgi:hypothetical protein
LLLFVYAVVNFALFFLQVSGTPSVRGSQYIVNNHGHVREISEEEYHHLRAMEIRGFSGHWMVFYWAGVVMVYCASRRHRER